MCSVEDGSMIRPDSHSSFVEAVGEEVNILIVETQCYYPFKLRSEIASRTNVECLGIQGEASRLISRLAWLVAWVGFERAVHAGETIADDLRPILDDTLGQYLTEAVSDPDLWIPERLESLLDRSRTLLLSTREADCGACLAVS